MQEEEILCTGSTLKNHIKREEKASKALAKVGEYDLSKVVTEVVDKSRVKLDDCGQKEVIFSKDALSELKKFLSTYFRYQKVVAICSSAQFGEFEEGLKSEDYQLVTITIDSTRVGDLDEVAKVISDEHRLLVACGDDATGNAVKYLSSKCSKKYLLYLNELTGVEYFSKYALVQENIFTSYQCDEPMKIYVDTFKLISTPRDKVANTLMSIIAKLGFLTDYYITFYANKIAFNENVLKRVKDLLNNICGSINKLYILNADELINFQKNISSLAVCLEHLGASWWSQKENAFASLYDYFADVSLPLGCRQVLGMQIYQKLYYDFLSKLGEVEFSYIELEKRIAAYDSLFKNIKLSYNFLNFPDLKRLRFILLQNQEKMLSKVKLLNLLSTKMVQKALKMYTDSGYFLTNDINNDVSVLASAFTPDVLCEGSVSVLSVILRDSGLLDFYK